MLFRSRSLIRTGERCSAGKPEILADDWSPAPHDRPMHRSKTFRQVASATALVGALGAVTAFGVAPLTKIELPTLEFVTEPLLLAQHATDSFLPLAGSFHQSETVRRGDTLAALIGRMGQ